jgi:integrase
MPRPLGTGLRVKRHVLADGTRIEYFRNRYTGQSLGTDRAIAEARMREWIDAQVPSRPVGKASLDALITDYLRTKAFANCKPGTQQFYRRYLDQLRSRFGSMPVEMITPAWIERLKLDLQDQPFKCNHTLAVLKIILRWGVKLGYCKTNVAREVEKLEVKPRDQIWMPDEITSFLNNTKGSLRLAMALMLGTAQRLSDVLAMTKGQVSERDGRLFIALRQQKTDKLLDAPIPRGIVETLLRERIAEQDDSLLLVRSPRGLQWARRNFSRAWDKARERIGLPELQRRDLRRTAVVFMASQGVPDSQITHITGHSAETTKQILRVYLPQRPEIALAAVETWEARGFLPERLKNVVTLGQKREERSPRQKANKGE